MKDEGAINLFWDTYILQDLGIIDVVMLDLRTKKEYLMIKT